MLEAVAQQGIRPDTVVGSSLGPSMRGTRRRVPPAQLQEFWDWLLAEVMTSLVGRWRGSLGQAIPQTGGDGPLLVAACCRRGSTSCRSHCALVATDLETGDAVILDSGTSSRRSWRPVRCRAWCPPPDV